jgi:hypothetical protein
VVKRLFAAPVSETEPKDPVQTFYLRIPADRGEQLRALADSHETLATFMLADWVVDLLDELDPDGEFLPPDPDSQLAPVIRLPVSSRQQPVDV